MEEQQEPRLAQVYDGWQAHGDGWAVYGATQEKRSTIGKQYNIIRRF